MSMLVPCLLMRALKWPHLFEEQADTPVAVTCESCWYCSQRPDVLCLAQTSFHSSVNEQLLLPHTLLEPGHLSGFYRE